MPPAWGAPLNTLMAKHLRLTCPNTRRYALRRMLRQGGTPPALVTITLNGEPHQIDGPVSVSMLLASLAIDSRRVAVEHNQVVVRRALFDSTIVGEGDAVEIVNFVGGGAPAGSAASPLKIPIPWPPLIPSSLQAGRSRRG